MGITCGKVRLGAFPSTKRLKMRTRCWIKPNHSQFVVIILSGPGSRVLVKQKGAVCWLGFHSPVVFPVILAPLEFPSVCSWTLRSLCAEEKRRQMIYSMGAGSAHRLQASIVWSASPLTSGRGCNPLPLSDWNETKSTHPSTPWIQKINSIIMQFVSCCFIPRKILQTKRKIPTDSIYVPGNNIFNLKDESSQSGTLAIATVALPVTILVLWVL